MSHTKSILEAVLSATTQKVALLLGRQMNYLGTSEKVSILMPVYNESKHIIECVQSIINQSYSNFELIVVDDFSDDDTFYKVSSVEDKRILCLKNRTKGKVSAFNLAYENSSGYYVVYLGGDDILPEQSLEARIGAMERISDNPELNLAAYGKLRMFSTNSKYNGITLPRRGKKGHASGGTLVLNRSLADLVFPIPETLPNEDTWTRLCIDGFSDKVGHTDEVVLNYRIHRGNSHARDMKYSEMNDFLHKRYMAYDEFYRRKSKCLSSSEKENLKKGMTIERKRYEKNVTYLFLHAMSGDRFAFSALFSSHPILYALKKKIYWVKRILP